MNDVSPAAGIKICLGTNRPLIGHSGVLLTPYARRVNGINEVTAIDPSLAPPGKHLIMSHQALQSDDIQSEIELGLKDLDDIFPGDDYEGIDGPDLPGRLTCEPGRFGLGPGQYHAH